MDSYVMFQVPQGWKRPRPEDLPSPCDDMVMMSVLSGLAGDITAAFVLTSRVAAAHHPNAAAAAEQPGGPAELPWAHWGCVNGHVTCFAAASKYVAEDERKELLLPDTSQSFMKDVEPKLLAAMRAKIAKGQFAGVKNKGKEKAAKQN